MAKIQLLFSYEVVKTLVNNFWKEKYNSYAKAMKFEADRIVWKDITKNKIVRPGQFTNLKGAEIISRTKETLTLIKGRSLFIYELKRLELKVPAVGQVGEKLDLKWPSGQEKAQAVKSLELEKHKSRVRSQQEAIK